MKKSIFLLSYLLVLLGKQVHAATPLQATYTIISSWTTGYLAEATITNSSSTAVTSWTVNFSLAQGQTVNCFWNNIPTQSGQNVSAANIAANGTLQAGQSLTMGFQVNGTGPNALNGLTATGASNTSSGSNLAAVATTTTVWATAYQVNVTLTNNTAQPTSSWTAQFTLPAGNVLSANTTNGIFTSSGQTVTVKNTSNNGTIAAGGTTTFTMIINMPQGGVTTISNLQAVANGTITPVQLTAPTLQAISNSSGANQYTISWTGVTNATGYVLQSSTSSSFTNPVTVYSGTATSFTVSRQAVGTYFYQVMATAGSSISAPSNRESVTVTQTPPPVSVGFENSTWAEDWTNNLDTMTYIQGLSKGINTINVFVGQLDHDSSGNPMIDGYSIDTPGRPAGTGAFPNVAALTHFIAQCKAQGITVKLSIGGESSTGFGSSWNRLTSSNVSAYAQALVNFCQTTGADGIDFDDELEVNANATLAGMLAAEFKNLAPHLLTSFCVFAGISTSGPWHEIDSIFLQNAITSSGASAIDRVYVMSYYDGVTLAQNKQFMLLWKTWLQQNYSFSASQISVGVDPNDPNTSPSNGSLTAWVEFAARNGFSVAIWDQLGVTDFINHNWGQVVQNIYTGQ